MTGCDVLEKEEAVGLSCTTLTITGGTYMRKIFEMLVTESTHETCNAP